MMAAELPLCLRASTRLWSSELCVSGRVLGLAGRRGRGLKLGLEGRQCPWGHCLGQDLAWCPGEARPKQGPCSVQSVSCIPTLDNELKGTWPGSGAVQPEGPGSSQGGSGSLALQRRRLHSPRAGDSASGASWPGFGPGLAP